jgi:hypothetical protein
MSLESFETYPQSVTRGDELVFSPPRNDDPLHSIVNHELADLRKKVRKFEIVEINITKNVKFTGWTVGF